METKMVLYNFHNVKMLWGIPQKYGGKKKNTNYSVSSRLVSQQVDLEKTGLRGSSYS